MKLIVGIVLILLLSGGLGAYIGDRFGKRIGKRKVSIFALRPKTSSTVLTVLMGMSISLGLLGLLVLISPPSRLALFQPDWQAQEASRAYLEEIQKVNRSLQRIQNQVKTYQYREALLATQLLMNQEPKPAGLKQPVARLASSQPGGPSPAENSQAARLSAYQSLARLPNGSLDRTRLEAYQKALLANTDEAGRMPQLLARQGDVLFSFSLDAPLASTSEQVLREILTASSQYAEKLGANAKDEVFIQIDHQNIAKTLAVLKAGQKGSLEVAVAVDSHDRQPLPVQLKFKETVPTPITPHDVLEKERLKGQETQTAIKQDLNEAILTIVKKRQDEGKAPVDYKAPPALDKAKFHSPQAYIKTAQEYPVKVRIDELSLKENTIYGKIKAEQSPVPQP